MSEAVLVDVTNATKDLIAAHDFGVPFETKFAYSDITRKLTEITELYVDFVPWRSTSQLTARGVLEYTCEVDLVARKKFDDRADTEQHTGNVDPSEVNRLLLLMQDLDEYFIQSGRELTLSSGGWVARLKKTEKKLDYHRPHLLHNSQFTGWNRVTYLAAKQI